MTTEIEKYRKAVIEHLRNEGKLAPLSIEKSEREYQAAPDMPLSDVKQEEIIQKVMAGNIATNPFPAPPKLRASVVQRQSVGAEFAHLNRNKGCDESAQSLLQKLREEALSNDGQGDCKDKMEAKRTAEKTRKGDG